MVLGSLIKAGVTLGAAAVTSDKLADAINGAVEKTTSRLAQASAARGDGTSSPTEPVNTTAKCIGCHAPMSGRIGDSYQCPYCDTEQTIS
jgi:cytochrome c553